MIEYQNIPPQLTALPHWVLWKYETREGKKTKVPFNAARPASGAMSNNAATWAPFEAAKAAIEANPGFDGIGFMLDPQTRIVGVDIDHCLNRETGELSELAQRVVSALDTYSEITPSGEGLRLFCFGELPKTGRKKGDIEMYSAVRFLTVTGRAFGDSRAVNDCNSALLELHAEIFPPEAPREVSERPLAPVDVSDQELLDRMLASSSGPKISALMSGNFAAYFSSQSEADSALCFSLAWWTNRDANRVDSLFRRSNLMREKWDKRHSADGRTYGQLTVERAVSGVSGGYDPLGPESGGMAKIGGSVGFVGRGYEQIMESEEGSVGFVGRGQVNNPKIETPEFEGHPAPISTQLLPVHRLTPSDIPPSLRGWISDIAGRMSVPLEYPMAGALVALSSLIGRQIAIRPKQFDDWTVIPNLWGMVVGNPGQQKTPTADEALKPLKRLEAEAAERYKLELEKHESTMMVAKMKSKAVAAELERKAKARAPQSELEALAQEAREIDTEMEAPTQRRYVVNDATIESLALVMQGNPNGVLVARDEISAWLKNLNKAGREADRGFYLEAWNGNGTMTYDRIGRGLALFIPSICASVFGTIQPGVLAQTVRGAAQGEGADGLIQRFQILMFPDAVPFKHVDRYPDKEARAQANEIFDKLSGFLAYVNNNNNHNIISYIYTDEYDSSSIPFLRFAPDAQEFFNEWWTDLEVVKLRGREAPIIESHLSKYRSLMPSLALIFHLIEVVDGAADGPVSLEAAMFAAGWCDILESHARRVYQMSFDGDPEPAIRLSERLKQSLPNPFTARQVVQKGWSGLTTTEEVDRAVMVLEDRGWIKTVETPATPQGGRPSRQHFINPEVGEEPSK